MAPAGRPTETTPDAWVDAALLEIADHGVPILSVHAVARRLGVTKGGFYHHFTDRRQLLQAALARWEHRFVADLAERFDTAADARQRLATPVTRNLSESARLGTDIVRQRGGGTQFRGITDLIR